MENLRIAKTPSESLGNWEAIDVFLFKNGQKDAPPRKYHFTQNDLCFWNETLKSIADVYNESEQSLALHKLNGQKIEGPLELQHGAAYVVVFSNERFKDSGYASYMVQASRSMDKRLKQTNNRGVNLVPTLHKISGNGKNLRKNTTQRPQTEYAKEKETKSKPSNVTQINSLLQKPVWPAKRKEDINVQKTTRSPSPNRRRSSPLKKNKTYKRDSSLTNPPKIGNNREMISFNNRDTTTEGVHSYKSNIGELADIFRDMDIKKKLDNDQKLLILLNEKKFISKVDVGMQVLVVNMDDSTDPPIDLLEFDDKGVQKPSDTSVCYNNAKDGYIALMQPDGSIQLTIKASDTGDGVITDITDKTNVDVFKIDGNAEDDKIAEFCVDQSLGDKVIVDTKIIKVIVIRCVCDDSKNEDEINSTADNSITRIVENEELENYQVPLQTQNEEKGEPETITKKTNKNTVKNTIIYSKKSDAVEKNIQNQYIDNLEEKILNENNQNKVDVVTEYLQENIETNVKSVKRVSMCLDEKKEEIDRNWSPETSITIVEAGKKITDCTSKRLSITLENPLQQHFDNVFSSCLLHRQRKSYSNVLDANDNSLISKALPTEIIPDKPRLSKESRTNQSQIINSTNEQDVNPSSTEPNNSRFENLNTYTRNCDYCRYNPPPCPPHCTPLMSVTPTICESDLCVCQEPSEQYCQYIQTDSCEILLMVRRHFEDSQFSFHFPTIKDLKDYKLI